MNPCDEDRKPSFGPFLDEPHFEWWKSIRRWSHAEQLIGMESLTWNIHQSWEFSQWLPISYTKAGLMVTYGSCSITWCHCHGETCAPRFKGACLCSFATDGKSSVTLKLLLVIILWHSWICMIEYLASYLWCGQEIGHVTNPPLTEIKKLVLQPICTP